MVVNVHAGHAPAGCKGCGAVGYLNESAVARQIKDEVILQLQQKGHKVYDTTYNKAGSASTVLNNIIRNCNLHKVDLDVSIHLNAGAKRGSDGRVTGTEVWVYNLANPKTLTPATKICNKMKALGFTNRGVKQSKTLAFLKKTKSPAILVEVCFVDDEDDYKLYLKTGYRNVAKAIVEGIV